MREAAHCLCRACVREADRRRLDVALDTEAVGPWLGVWDALALRVDDIVFQVVVQAVEHIPQGGPLRLELIR